MKIEVFFSLIHRCPRPSSSISRCTQMLQWRKLRVGEGEYILYIILVFNSLCRYYQTKIGEIFYPLRVFVTSSAKSISYTYFLAVVILITVL